jgi:hypothetical protein
VINNVTVLGVHPYHIRVSWAHLKVPVSDSKLQPHLCAAVGGMVEVWGGGAAMSDWGKLLGRRDQIDRIDGIDDLVWYPPA